MTTINGNWIWAAKVDGRQYNQCVTFRREIKLDNVTSGRIAITADTYYRLKINGQWLNDGPGRSYPEHYQFDVLDLGGVLRNGNNLLEVTVRYFGCGTFHQIPQRAGFLAELCVDKVDGSAESIVTDDSWLAAIVPQWVVNTPKAMIQQAPFEFFDASNEQKLEFSPAEIICPAGEGPWQNLNPRDCRLLTRREFLCKRFDSAKRVRPQMTVFSIPLKELAYPGDTSANNASSIGIVMALNVEAAGSVEIKLQLHNAVVSVNGVVSTDGIVKFKKGANLLLAGCHSLYNHQSDLVVGFPANSELRFSNILDGGSRVAVYEFKDLYQLAPDIPFLWANDNFQQRNQTFVIQRDEMLQIKNIEEFIRRHGDDLTMLDPGKLSQDQCHWSFLSRQAIDINTSDIEHPEYMLYPDNEFVTVNPVNGYDVELCYDLGEQNIGFWNFALEAEAGTIVDIAAVEYLTPSGKVQHTNNYRNAMRYICCEGHNRYISMKRRSGRYIFITLRNYKRPVKFQFFRLIESTYPVSNDGSFFSSDPKLNKIYDISLRTLKLCMEDTFTDCPLYEQTLWVGDARNESLFAMSSFGAYDLVKRCIKLAGQSLERYPMVACQVPSGWDSIIPVWSFMWGISIEDYYNETGDADFVREMWPYIQKNLAGAFEKIDPATGLLRCKEWNLFDWSKTDANHETLVYNSMFLAGALNAAINLAPVIGETCEELVFSRAELVKAINRVWDNRKLAWPDRIDENGKGSSDIAVHTSMLSILYDCCAPEHFAMARANTISPRNDLIKISSPFASLYLYETFDKLELYKDILEAVYRDYLPMVDLDASTVWETYAGAFEANGAFDFANGFPTRSHCHGWSAAPVYFLPKIVLGISPVGAGGKKFKISPFFGNLEFASGVRPTVRGRIEVAWRKTDVHHVVIKVKAPAEIELEYAYNGSHDNLTVTMERV